MLRPDLPGTKVPVMLELESKPQNIQNGGQQKKLWNGRQLYNLPNLNNLKWRTTLIISILTVT